MICIQITLNHRHTAVQLQEYFIVQEYFRSTSGVQSTLCCVLSVCNVFSVCVCVCECRTVSKQQTPVGCVPARLSSTNQLQAPPHVVLLFTTRLESHRGGCWENPERISCSELNVQIQCGADILRSAD